MGHGPGPMSDNNGAERGRLVDQGTTDQDGPQAPLVLASASPRRKELLAGLGLEFQVRPAEIPEDPLPGEFPRDLVRRLSLAKAAAISTRIGRGFVVGADSLVVLDGEVFGKPTGADQARQMLETLRGTQHLVVTGLTVIDAASGEQLTDSMSSRITLRDITGAEIAKSIASGVPFDKAGAYAVQDPELRPAQSWEGCYSNIVGLPLCRLTEMLESLGFPLPQRHSMRVPKGCTGECPFTPGGTP